MINYKELLENKIIDRQQFLLNYYHLINISETELVIILLIENMLETNDLVTTKALEDRMNISAAKIEVSLKKLIEKHYLTFDNYSPLNTIDTSIVYEKIIDCLIKSHIEVDNKEKEVRESNIVSVFEDEFKRKMTPFEIETIREWNSSFNTELIIYALKEAVLSGVINFKYIERIIVEQAKLINGQ